MKHANISSRCSKDICHGVYTERTKYILRKKSYRIPALWTGVFSSHIKRQPVRFVLSLQGRSGGDGTVGGFQVDGLWGSIKAEFA